MSFNLKKIKSTLPFSLRGGAGDDGDDNDRSKSSSRLEQILKQAVVNQDDGIKKSVSDTRDYRLITLPNKLQALLVSDPKTEKSAASLSVNVGSYSDPEELPGLAHFLEHMLFMGTKKFPDENEYSKFLSENGGFSNAFTSREQTNYHFDVISNQLFPALDRFAQFFISPLLSESGTERELKAVDNECSGNSQNDAWRAYLIYRELAHEKHPVHKFNIGNLETLKHQPLKKNIKVREALFKFYDQFYSANRMKLVVVGKETLNELEKFVTELFSEVPNKDLECPYVHPDPSGAAFDEKNLGKIIKVVPVMDIRKIELIWILPRFTHQNKLREASSYLCSLLGDEGEGSILSYLKKQCWANALTASVSDDSYDLAALEVIIFCTDNGISNHVEDIVEVVYNYINMMKDCFTRPEECSHFFEEEKILSAISFWFKSDARPVSLAIETAGKLQRDIDPKECFVYRLNLRDTFKEVVHLTSFLKVENSMVFLSWKNNVKEADREETYFKTKFGVSDISQKLVEQWNSASEYKKLGLNLTLPNKFIPSSFDVKPFEKPKPVTKVPSTSSKLMQKIVEEKTVKGPKMLLHASSSDKISVVRDVVERSVSEVWEEDTFRRPIVVSADETSTLWLKQDTTHKKPKAVVEMIVRNSFLTETVDNEFAFEVYLSMVADVLNEETYAATMAGFSYSLNLSNEGLILGFIGFAETLHSFVELVVSKLKSFMNEKPDLALFNRFKEQKMKSVINLEKVRPVNLAFMAVSEALKERSETIETKFFAVKNLDLETVLKKAPKLFENVSLEMLVCGNARKKDALKVMEISKKIFNPQRNVSEIDCLRTVDLIKKSPAQHFILKSARNKDNPGSAMCVVFQLGVTNSEKSALTDILSEYLSESFFNKLRTQQSLGYIVSSRAVEAQGLVSLLFYVESNSADPIVLNQRLEIFIDELEKEFDETFTEEKFKDIINAVLNSRMQRAKSVAGESGRWFGKIASGLYSFNKNFQVCQSLLKVKPRDLKKLLEEFVFKSASKRAKIFSGVLADVHGKKIFGKDYVKLKPKVVDGVQLNFNEKFVLEWMNKDKKLMQETVDGRGELFIIENNEEFKNKSQFFPTVLEIYSNL